MKTLQHLALILSLTGAMLLSPASLAADPAPAAAATATATPATTSAAAGEKAAPKLEELMSGSKPERCRTPGMGMPGGPMGMMGMMGKCDHPDCPKDKCLHGPKEKCDHPGHHAQHGHHGQPCKDGGDLEMRVEMLEKRLDMMQMMLRKMMRE